MTSAYNKIRRGVAYAVTSAHTISFLFRCRPMFVVQNSFNLVTYVNAFTRIRLVLKILHYVKCLLPPVYNTIYMREISGEVPWSQLYLDIFFLFFWRTTYCIYLMNCKHFFPWTNIFVYLLFIILLIM